jgi:superfamily II DNA or RNA helicase
MLSSATLNLFDDSFRVHSSTNGEAYAPSAPVIEAPPMGNVIEFPLSPSGPRVLEDRWYQTNALADIAARLPLKGKRRGGKGELLVCPTGGGKTSIASRAIKSWLDARKRVLILVDLERLLDQMRDDWRRADFPAD